MEQYIIDRATNDWQNDCGPASRQQDSSVF